MIKKKTLKDLANKRYRDAKVLLKNRRYQGSIYLGGYVLELLLKYNICMIFNFKDGFPETKDEFIRYKILIDKIAFVTVSGLKDFKTHNLEILLKYSGREYEVKDSHLSDWITILNWDPESRYKDVKTKSSDAKAFLNSLTKLKKILY